MTRQQLVEIMPGAPPPVAAKMAPVRDGMVPAPAPAALVVADLSKSFRSGFLRRPVSGIDGVSFTVNRGEVFALLGHNGAGKTTTISCILDLVRPDRGEVSLLGRDYRDGASRARVGYLPERPYFFEYLTGRELLGFYATLLDIPSGEHRLRIDTVLKQVDMTADANRRLGKYSKGMLQRMGLAQALLGDPQLLILDEPMSGLDPMGRREVRELLLDLKRQGCTILLSSHIVPDVEQLADKVGILRGGRLVTVHALGASDNGFTYRLNLAGNVQSVREAGLPDWALTSISDAGNGTVRIEIGSVELLRILLEACHRARVSVLSVDAIRSGLEDLFMQTHAQEGIQ